MRGSAFTAIDFETASRESTSACAVGLVRVEDGRVVERFVSRIRPPARTFEFTSVHGLTWEDCRDAPSFRELWPAIARLTRGVRYLAAHHAAFDAGVLRAACARSGKPLPPLPFLCTVALARARWGIRPTKLPLVCARLGIALRHHDPLSDAAACAEIVLQAGRAAVRRLLEEARGGEDAAR